MTDLDVTGLCVDLAGRQVIIDVSLTLAPGELVALLGPNGAGKTTLLRAVLGLVPRRRGRVQLGGDDPARLAPAERARRVAYLPQVRALAWPLPVRDLVALGRFAHGAALGRLGAADARAVARALDACELLALAHRPSDSLSGGELSRAHLARALAAHAPMLLADEPVAALDPLHQLQVMSLLRAHAHDGHAALVVLHDAALAARFATRLAWLKDGRLVADGPPAETLTATRFREVYGVHAVVRQVDGHWLVAPEHAA